MTPYSLSLKALLILTILFILSNSYFDDTYKVS